MAKGVLGRAARIRALGNLGPTDRDVGFGGYLAALQQEEHAAQVYQGQLERARRRTTGRIGPDGWHKALA